MNISHGTKFGNEAVYSCSDGYLLIGQKKRTCTENGTWSPEIDGICDRKCALINSNVNYFHYMQLLTVVFPLILLMDEWTHPLEPPS